MSSKLEIVQAKLNQKLVSSGWSDVLGSYILSDEFSKILEFLRDEKRSGKPFTPALKNVFRAFEECPWDKLKVVVVGQDPYPQPDTADGIAFSCGLKNKPEKSLQYMFSSLEGKTDNFNPDLTRWSNQGVLMLNTAFTVQVKKIGSHVNIWKEFTNNVLSKISQDKIGIPFVFLGAKAKQFDSNVSDNHKKLYASHPASAAYKGGKWDCNNIWDDVNENLIAQNKLPINW